MIERVYPGVYVTELASGVKPIEGVSTSPAPPWTDHNENDPGLTLLELLSWTADGLLYRAGRDGDAVLRAGAAPGVVAGLAVDAPDHAATPAVSVAPGLAIGPDGRGIDSGSARVVHHRHHHRHEP
jgi:hypothetical protein